MVEELTEKEKTLLILCLQGKTEKQVADMMFVSKRTISWQLEKIYEKLEVCSLSQARNRAIRLGIWDGVV